MSKKKKNPSKRRNDSRWNTAEDWTRTNEDRQLMKEDKPKSSSKPKGTAKENKAGKHPAEAGMSEYDKSFAPYLFFPMEEEIQMKDPYATGQISENGLPSFRDLYGANSGYIDYSFETLTPIAVQTGRKEGEFCKDVNGDYIVPGSSMKGFIRNHAEILSFANPAVNGLIDDRLFKYRSFASNSSSRRKEYNDSMKVKAGYIYYTEDDEGDHYWIKPVKDFGKYNKTFFKVHESDLYDENGQRILDADQYMYTVKIDKHDSKKNITVEDYNDYLKDHINPDYHPYRSSRIIKFDYNKKDKIHHVGRKDARESGMVLNSAHIDDKTSHYLVSIEKSDKTYKIPAEDWQEYVDDYNENCTQNKDLLEYTDFYELPKKPGEEKLFFFCVTVVEEDGKKKEVVKEFGPSPYFRIKYKHTTLEGIPASYQREGIDYVSAMFGYIDEKKDRGGSYKSRLSFENAKTTAKPATAKARLVLATPRATAVQMYLDQPSNDKNQLVTYDADSFRLRGYKAYWKRKGVRQWQTLDESDNEKIRSYIETLPEKTVFKGRIYFDNLSDAEVGLLLMAIKFDDAKAESYMIGKAKPYGYGKIEIKDVKLHLFDNNRRFTSIDLSDVASIKEGQPYKDAFVKAIMDVEDLAEAKKKYLEHKVIRLYARYAETQACGQNVEPTEHAYMDLDGYGRMIPLPRMEEILQ